MIYKYNKSVLAVPEYCKMHFMCFDPYIKHNHIIVSKTVYVTLQGWVLNIV